jgi:hypothetical protein
LKKIVCLLWCILLYADNISLKVGCHSGGKTPVQQQQQQQKKEERKLGFRRTKIW